MIEEVKAYKVNGKIFETKKQAQSSVASRIEEITSTHIERSPLVELVDTLRLSNIGDNKKVLEFIILRRFELSKMLDIIRSKEIGRYKIEDIDVEDTFYNSVKTESPFLKDFIDEYKG